MTSWRQMILIVEKLQIICELSCSSDKPFKYAFLLLAKKYNTFITKKKRLVMIESGCILEDTSFKQGSNASPIFGKYIM